MEAVFIKTAVRGDASEIEEKLKGKEEEKDLRIFL